MTYQTLFEKNCSLSLLSLGKSTTYQTFRPRQVRSLFVPVARSLKNFCMNERGGQEK